MDLQDSAFINMGPNRLNNAGVKKWKTALLTNTELRLLLQVVGVFISAKDINRAQDDSCNLTDKERIALWTRINFLANKNRVTGFLYSSLRESKKISLIPETLQHNLKVTQGALLRKELFYAGIILKLRRLRPSNASIWVSGSFLLARCIFPDRGQISFDYMEIFTSSSELETLSEDIKCLGFSRQNNLYVSSNAQIKLQVFSEPLLPGVAALTFKDIQVYSCSYDIGGHMCQGPAPELLLVYIACRCKSKKWCNLASFLAAKMCVIHEQFSWEQLATITELHKANVNMQSFLLALKILFKINIPASFVSSFPIFGSRTNVSECTDQILSHFLCKPSLRSIEMRNAPIVSSNNLGEFVGTPDVVVKKMLELADIKPNDVICDLGCGDGRFLIEAALHYNCGGFGVDYDEQRIAEANQNAVMQKVTKQLNFRIQDALDADLSKATIVISYLNNTGNMKLLPKIRKELSPGTRVLTHQFWFPGISPEKIVTIETGFAHYTDIYIWNLWS